ncbi:MAG: hypothetical protein ACM30G_04970 [Micromonosporaceae bacterium]
MQFKELSGTLYHRTYIPSQATLGTDDNWPLFQADSKMKVISVSFVPSDAITANATHYSVYTLTRYTAGATATSVATRSWAATNSVAETPEAMTLSGTAANLILAAADTLSMVKTHGGNGLVIPDGLLVIGFRYLGVS